LNGRPGPASVALMPPPRSLALADPLMTGDDVRGCQQLLAANRYGDFAPGEADGEYGQVTAAAVDRAKWALGYPKRAIDGVFGPTLRSYLEGAALPPAFRARATLRKRQATRGGDVRGRIVQQALWAIANEPSIAYSNGRPIDGTGAQPRVPLAIDCSGFVTLCYQWAGAPDPNGLRFSGAGFTGSLLGNCRRIGRAAAQPGDLVVWGDGNGRHVALVLEPGPDPVLASHGSDGGPKRVPFSRQNAWHQQQGHTQVTWLTCLP
jgi:cell wall-associated NlpC family hydrolase